MIATCPQNTPHIPSRYNNEQTTKQTKAINNYIYISCKSAGHFTLDVHASRPVACCLNCERKRRIGVVIINALVSLSLKTLIEYNALGNSLWQSYAKWRHLVLPDGTQTIIWTNVDLLWGLVAFTWEQFLNECPASSYFAQRVWKLYISDYCHISQGHFIQDPQMLLYFSHFKVGWSVRPFWPPVLQARVIFTYFHYFFLFFRRSSKVSRKMPRLPPAYRGPAAVMGVGAAFAIVGTLPVAVTLAMGVRTTATVIGVGFMGFGVMLILPGLCWCIAVNRRRGRWWRGGRDQEGQEDALSPTPALRWAIMPTYNVLITSLLRQNDVTTSFWRNNDVIIMPSVHWVLTLIYNFFPNVNPS